MRPKVGADGKYRATQISDSQINGFYAVCTRPGVISFHVRHAGKKYKCGNYLGTSNSITNARDLARKFIAAIRLGTDPATVRIENATKPTLGQVVEKLLKDNEYLQNFKVGMSRDQLVWRLNTYFLHKAKDKNLRKFERVPFNFIGNRFIVFQAECVLAVIGRFFQGDEYIVKTLFELEGYFFNFYFIGF